MFMKSAIFCAALLAGNAALAATVYDESVSGDAIGSVVPGTDVGTLGTGISTILGSYDAIGEFGADEQDSYTFTALTDFTVSATTLSGDSGYYFLYTLAPAYLDSGYEGSDMFGTIAAGTYSLSIVGSGNDGAGSYEITIVTSDMPAVPLPAAGGLLFGALGSLMALRRRKA